MNTSFDSHPRCQQALSGDNTSYILRFLATFLSYFLSVLELLHEESEEDADDGDEDLRTSPCARGGLERRGIQRYVRVVNHALAKGIIEHEENGLAVEVNAHSGINILLIVIVVVRVLDKAEVNATHSHRGEREGLFTTNLIGHGTLGHSRL